MADDPDVPPNVAQAYRALGREEPPRALDEAILAAARRPVRPWTQRWALPLSVAAVVVLSVTVTLRIQDEGPGLEQPQDERAAKQVAAAPAAAPPAPLKLPVEGELKPQRESRATSADRVRNEPAPAPQARLDQPALQGGIKSAQPFPAEAPATAAPPAAPASIESSGAGAAARQESERALRDADAVARAPQAGPAQALAKRGELAEAAKSTAETPEQELERIARLRAAGRNDEADKALAEFRKRHPDYRIPEAMLQRLERR